MSDPSLEIEFNTQKQALLSLKQILEDRLTALKNDARQSHSADFAEQVTERENDDVVNRLIYDTQTEHALVNHALERMDEGEYGCCEDCGDDINLARLEVVPYATRCMKCAD